MDKNYVVFSHASKKFLINCDVLSIFVDETVSSWHYNRWVKFLADIFMCTWQESSASYKTSNPIEHRLCLHDCRHHINISVRYASDSNAPPHLREILRCTIRSICKFRRDVSCFALWTRDLWQSRHVTNRDLLEEKWRISAEA